MPGEPYGCPARTLRPPIDAWLGKCTVTREQFSQQPRAITNPAQGRGEKTQTLYPRLRIHLASVVPVVEEMCQL